jgi:hypothetical protein
MYDYMASTKHNQGYWTMSIQNMTIERNLVLYNHLICDHMQVIVICNYVLSFLQLVIILFNLFFFL